MKRILSLILLAVLFLSGCTLAQEQVKEPVEFYYLRQHADADDYDLFFSEGAIGSEIREATGHQNDLNYLLALYMQGPKDSGLLFPFPVGSKITNIHMDGGKLTVTMNAITSRFNEMDVTVSCACLAKTCMELVDVEEVEVESYAPDGRILFSRTFTVDNLILQDEQTLPPESVDETK